MNFDEKLTDILNPFEKEDRVKIMGKISSFGIKFRAEGSVNKDWIESSVSGYSDAAKNAVFDGSVAWLEYQLNSQGSSDRAHHQKF
jgi:hypothetical protein